MSFRHFNNLYVRSLRKSDDLSNIDLSGHIVVQDFQVITQNSLNFSLLCELHHMFITKNFPGSVLYSHLHSVSLLKSYVCIELKWWVESLDTIFSNILYIKDWQLTSLYVKPWINIMHMIRNHSCNNILSHV
jgi:hypothetical protein